MAFVSFSLCYGQMCTLRSFVAFQYVLEIVSVFGIFIGVYTRMMWFEQIEHTQGHRLITPDGDLYSRRWHFLFFFFFWRVKTNTFFVCLGFLTVSGLEVYRSLFPWTWGEWRGARYSEMACWIKRRGHLQDQILWLLNKGGSLTEVKIRLFVWWNWTKTCGR